MSALGSGNMLKPWHVAHSQRTVVDLWNLSSPRHSTDTVSGTLVCPTPQHPTAKKTFINEYMRVGSVISGY